VSTARVNSIHHQGIKDLAPGFEIEAWSLPDRVPEAIRRRPDRGRSYIAATQWHPEFHKYGSTETVDDTPILHDFLWACATAKVAPRTHARAGPGKIRDRAARVLRQALLRR
jgi:putative glutamine amidotransferase